MEKAARQGSVTVRGYHYDLDWGVNFNRHDYKSKEKKANFTVSALEQNKNNFQESAEKAYVSLRKDMQQNRTDDYKRQEMARLEERRYMEEQRKRDEDANLNKHRESLTLMLGVVASIDSKSTQTQEIQSREMILRIAIDRSESKLIYEKDKEVIACLEAKIAKDSKDLEKLVVEKENIRKRSTLEITQILGGSALLPGLSTLSIQDTPKEIVSTHQKSADLDPEEELGKKKKEKGKQEESSQGMKRKVSSRGRQEGSPTKKDKSIH